MYVRRVRLGDASLLGDLFSRIDTTHFHPHPMTAEGAAAIASCVGRDVYLIGCLGDEAIAYGMLRGWDAGFDVPSLGIAVRVDHNGHGHARRMMSVLHDAARLGGSSVVRLRVAPDNLRARRLYEALGYKDAGEERGELLMLLGLYCATPRVMPG